MLARWDANPIQPFNGAAPEAVVAAVPADEPMPAPEAEDQEMSLSSVAEEDLKILNKEEEKKEEVVYATIKEQVIALLKEDNAGEAQDFQDNLDSEVDREDVGMSSVEGSVEPEDEEPFTAGSLLQYGGKVYLPKWPCSHKIEKALDYISDPKSEDDTYSAVLQDKLIE
jgi:hypothetical protein